MPAFSQNKRIFYPAHQVGVKPASDNDYTFASGDVIHGVQSVGLSTNFNLSPIFELGQSELYENREELPDVEMTISKVLDGYAPIYLKATQDGDAPTLIGKSNARCMAGISIFRDTEVSATGTPLSSVACSGMFVNSISYSFPLDSPFTEDVTLVGNNKLWYRTAITGRPAYGESDLKSMPSITFAGAFAAADAPLAAGGVAYREDMLFDPTGAVVDVNGSIAESDVCVFPQEVAGIGSNGINAKGDGENRDAHLSSVTCSVDLSREAINELGRKGPYHRAAQFPVQTTCEIQVTTTEGDLVSALEDGNFGTGTTCASNARNLENRTIRIATCDGLRIFLGKKNKLASVNYTGGDANGGNVTVSYSYTGYNDFTVMHEQDPGMGVAPYTWSSRATYLT